MAKEATIEKASRQVTIPASLHERLTQEATRRDVSVTFLVTRAVERVLPGLEAVDLERMFDGTGE